MIQSMAFSAAGVLCFGPIPNQWMVQYAEVAWQIVDGSQNASLILSAGFMRRKVATAGLVAAQADVGVIANSSQIVQYTAVAANVSAGPASRFILPAWQPMSPMEDLWFNLELETVTNLRGIVAIRMRPDPYRLAGKI